MSRERRLGSRTLVDLPADVLEDGFAHRCRVVELSQTGMLVSLNRCLASREPHLLGTYEIHIGGGRTLHVTARTVWRRDTMQAARFVVIREDERNALLEVLAAPRRNTSDVARLEAAERKDRARSPSERDY